MTTPAPRYHLEIAVLERHHIMARQLMNTHAQMPTSQRSPLCLALQEHFRGEREVEITTNRECYGKGYAFPDLPCGYYVDFIGLGLVTLPVVASTFEGLFDSYHFDKLKPYEFQLPITENLARTFGIIE